VTKRQVNLSPFDNLLDRSLTIYSRLSELEAKVALYEAGASIDQPSRIEADPSEPREIPVSTAQLESINSPPRQISAPDYTDHDVTEVNFDVDTPEQLSVNDQTAQEFSLSQAPAATAEEIDASPERQSSPESELMNPLALGISAYTPNAKSIPSQY
jgi:hypothetical protein